MIRMVTGLAVTSVVAIGAIYFVKANAPVIVKYLDKIKDRIQALADEETTTYDCVGDECCGHTCENCPNCGIDCCHSEE